MKLNKPKSSVYNYFSSNVFSAASDSLMENEMRFNAEFYEPNTTLLINKNIKFEPLSSFASVVFPGIFKRCLVEDVKYGIKFLTTSDMMMLEPGTDKILSIQLTSNLPIYRVSEHTLLVSRSGTIGNTMFVDSMLAEYAITEDALRVKPFDKLNMGVLYFYFTSDHGKNTITGKKSGAVIDHIYEDDLLKLQIPILPEPLTRRLFDMYLQVKKCREDATEIIEKASLLIYKYNNLPNVDFNLIETIDPEGLTQMRMTNISEFTDSYRLDAHFYNPIANTAITSIQNKASKYQPLSNLTKDIIIGKRFKRNYVESDHGTPFIGSKNILQIRPSELKYLSNTEIDFMDDLILKRGMILVACSGSLGGTFGKTSFVYNNFEGYAASQHILRIVVNEELIDPAYLYAFLSSEYGYLAITRFRWGALIDEIDDNDISQVLIPIPTNKQQKEIGDMIRQAYDFRGEAIRLEDEAQALLTQALTN